MEVVGDANNMWDKTSSCIEEEVRGVGLLRGNFGGHQGDEWWNGKSKEK